MFVNTIIKEHRIDKNLIAEYGIESLLEFNLSFPTLIPYIIPKQAPTSKMVAK